MKKLFLALQAEVVKQHHNSFHSALVYFSLLVWPILGFFTVWFTYKPFSLGGGGWLGIDTGAKLMVFISTGYMAYTCFWAMVQSAWQAGWQERQFGTLAIAFLSPANRLALLYGRALGALLQDTWMFLCFCVFILIYAGDLGWPILWQLPLVFLILIISATVWGGLMNALFLFSRDAEIVYNLCDDPMVLLAGVRVPVEGFPFWAQALSLIFPLTYCLAIIRRIFGGAGFGACLPQLWRLLACLALMIGLTVLAMKKAEAHNRETGEFSFY